MLVLPSPARYNDSQVATFHRGPPLFLRFSQNLFFSANLIPFFSKVAVVIRVVSETFTLFFNPSDEIKVELMDQGVSPPRPMSLNWIIASPGFFLLFQLSNSGISHVSFCC
jgi:hypothetical protein